MAPDDTQRKRLKWDSEGDVVSPAPKRRQIQIHARPPPSVFVPPRTHHPALTSSRSVYSYEKLNSIEEGSYGIVFRARDRQTGDIVALKKLKLDEEKSGFPITALREINALMVCRHDNVVRIREVVVGETLTQYARKTRTSTPVDFTHLLQGIHRDGLHRARPEIPPDPHAFPVLAIRNKNAHAPASVRRFPLSFQLDLAPRPEDEQPPHE